MTKRYTVSILGCGWFGYPLAKQLVDAGHQVKGSTTTTGKLADIRSAGIEAHLFSLDQDGDAGDFFQSEILILGIPPKLRTGSGDDYAGKIRRLTELLRGTPVKQVIFISSTSVFSETNSVLTEKDVPSPETSSGRAILAAESCLQDCSFFQTTVIRFSGLIGPGRDPGRFFAGKTDIPNGQAPVNLIHLDDCLRITTAILERRAFGHIFHAVTPQHPQKQVFYSKASQASGYKVPDFVDELISWKIIESVNVPKLLNYEFSRSFF
ncbi:SDR family oxidoreductase [Arcticibacter sp.]|uniref:SDR family oxidoreductase n=1 Tax=Arcticibacter sp. TaxID=1872630 RepID=UPI00388F270A